MTLPAIRSDFAHSLLTRIPWQWLALLALLAVAASASVGSYREIDAGLTASALSRRQAVAELAAATLAEKFGRLLDVSVALATRARLRELVADGRWDEAVAIMHNIPHDLPLIERLFLSDADGILRADTPALPGVRGVDFSHRDWFQGVSRGWRPYISSAYIPAAGPHQEVISVAAPIRDNADEVAGILVLQTRMHELFRWINDLDLNPQATVFVVDPSGQLVYRSGPYQGDITVPSVTASGAVLVHDPNGNEDHIHAYATVPGVNWKIMLLQPVHTSANLATRDRLLGELATAYGLTAAFAAAAIMMATKLVSARKRVESEARYQQTLDSMLEGAQIVDHDWRYVYVNDAAERQNRRPKSELLGRTMIEVWPGIERTEVFAAATQCMNEHSSTRLVTPFTFPDGFEGWYEVGIQAIPEGLFILSADITARKAAEDEIRRLNVELERKVTERTAQLEAANHELEAFSYSVSHDLRAPLRSIDGFSQALLEDCADRLDADGKGYLKRIRAATQRMGDLIDDLLLLSRVTRAEMQRQEVDLSALAAECVASLRQAEPERQVDVQIEPGLVAAGDRRLLQILLENLLGNAWKFTGKQPAARIVVGRGRTRNDENTVFFVRDNGVGFDPTYAHKLFAAFQRLHSPADFPGTGIGLATVQRIVLRHGGRAWAEGGVGEGATMYFSL